MGFVTKIAEMSGEILDKIQSGALNAVEEIANFLQGNSEGVTDFIDRFISAISNVEEWYTQNLENALRQTCHR